MGYMLPPAVSFALVDGRAIFLDISADRYFCVAPAQQVALNVLAAGELIESDAEAILEPLVPGGILIEVPYAARPTPCRLEDLPSISLVDEGLPRSGVWQVAAAAFSIQRTKLGLRHRSFQRMIDRLACLKSTVHRQAIEPSGMMHIAAAFEGTSLFLSPHRQCLPRSLALVTRLAGLGANVNLVIGVANNPFSAHCWVQHDAIVLNDRLEKVQGYTPVLVV
ncbi:MAG: lasso peptide biosynthesis B2 protein [Thermomicrobiales bacterium]